MSQNSNFLKTTLDLLETDPEVKSFIYQQILDFNPFVTPETLVMVIARDPNTSYLSEAEAEVITEEDSEFFDRHRVEEETAIASKFNYRIAVILKDGDGQIEAEAFANDIFEAIRSAKDRLVERLVQIQEEIESPQERLNAIKDASDNKLIH
jgi:hypothetical protein